MKIYLAGPCDTENRTTMVKIADWLTHSHHDVYKPWELKIENAWDYTQEVWAEKVFYADIQAIEKADVVVLISVGRISSAGTNWEQGYAYAKRKPVYVIQITDATTSLMTYCGCTFFMNANKDDLYKKIDWLGTHLTLDEDDRLIQLHYAEAGCETTLT